MQNKMKMLILAILLCGSGCQVVQLNAPHLKGDTTATVHKTATLVHPKDVEVLESYFGKKAVEVLVGRTMLLWIGYAVDPFILGTWLNFRAYDNKEKEIRPIIRMQEEYQFARESKIRAARSRLLRQPESDLEQEVLSLTVEFNKAMLDQSVRD